MAPKTVCIVGVAGFIGSHMLEKIVREKDWIVIGVDMVAPTKIQQLLGAEKKWASRFEFHQVQAGAARSDVTCSQNILARAQSHRRRAAHPPAPPPWCDDRRALSSPTRGR